MRPDLQTSSSSHLPPHLQHRSSIREIVTYWLQCRRGEVKPSTHDNYQQVARYIVGPLLIGSKIERCAFARRAVLADGAKLVEMLGDTPLNELTTAQIRQWHRTISELVGSYTAKVAKKHLRSALQMAAEDFGLSVPTMPTNRGRGKPKTPKAILCPSQIAQLLAYAKADQARGIYYAFPFWTGVRPSEQLGLLWEDVDLAAAIIRIRRVQERNGSLSSITKTQAGLRELPMPPPLRAMLEVWRPRCPDVPGVEPRVFPSLGNLEHRTHSKRGQPLSYANFLASYWRPAFAQAGLPYVTPHSARHSYISTLQAEGVEIGLVAKLAGHADPSVTLGVYTQAVRSSAVAVEALGRAYRE